MATPFEQAFAFLGQPQPQQSGNVLQQILGGGFNGGAPVSVQDPGPIQFPGQTVPGELPAVSNVRAPRDRASLLEVLGGIADAVATVGGAPAQFQPTIDARLNLQRQTEIDDLNRRGAEQQLQIGEANLGNVGREQLANVLAASADSDDPAGTFGALAQQAGIPPDKAAAIAAEIQRNPENAGRLARAFGFQPAAQGSQAKELQIFELLRQQNPELAEKFLTNVAQGGGINPLQQAQLDIALAGLGIRREAADLNREKFENPQPTAAERKEATKREAQLTSALQGFDTADQSLTRLRGAFRQLAEAGSISAPGQTGEGRIRAFVNEKVPFVERVFNPDGFTAREQIDTIFNNLVLETLPLLTTTQLGGKNFDAAKELEFHRKRIASAKDFSAAMTEIDALESKLDRARKAAETELQSAPAAPPSQRRNVRGGVLDPALEAELRRRGLR